MKAIAEMIWVLNMLETVACITAFVYYKKLKVLHWQWLSFYLLFIVLLEFTGRYLASTNQFTFNIYLFKYIGFPFQFFFFFFIFFNHDYFKNKKKWIIGAGFAYFSSIIFETLFLSHRYYWFHSFSYSIGNIILLILLLIYFFTFINSSEILQFTNSMMFWFCLGLFIYYLGTLPYWALRNVLVFKYRQVFETYSYVWLVLNYCMYLLFTIGIILCRQK